MGIGGYLYAIGMEGMSFVKIGCSTNVESRLRTLQISHPLPLCVLATVRVVTDMKRIEHQVHGLLADYRRRGEWFDVSIDAVQLVALAVRAGAVLDHTTEPAPMRPQLRGTGALTRQMIDATPCPSTGEQWLPDVAVPGLGVRLRPGRKTYSLRYRLLNGRSARYNLGPITVLSLDQARALARKFLAKVYPDDW